MQHEILAAMLGHPGSLFGPSQIQNKSSIQKYNFECNPLACSLLSQTEIAAVNRLIQYGGHVKFLREFVEKQSYMMDMRSAKSNCNRNSLYLRAVSSAVQKILSSYESAVIELERSLIKDPDLGVGFIYGKMELKIRWIPFLVELITAIDMKISPHDGSFQISTAKTVLELVHNHVLLCGDEHVRTILQTIESAW